jgi:hypothetical protein
MIKTKFWVSISGTFIRFDKLDIIKKNIPDFYKQIYEAAKIKELPKLFIVDEKFLKNLNSEISKKVKMNKIHTLIFPIYLDYPISNRIKPIALLGLTEYINKFVEKKIEAAEEIEKKRLRRN